MKIIFNLLFQERKKGSTKTESPVKNRTEDKPPMAVGDLEPEKHTFEETQHPSANLEVPVLQQTDDTVFDGTKGNSSNCLSVADLETDGAEELGSKLEALLLHDQDLRESDPDPDPEQRMQKEISAFMHDLSGQTQWSGHDQCNQNVALSRVELSSSGVDDIVTDGLPKQQIKHTVELDARLQVTDLEPKEEFTHLPISEGIVLDQHQTDCTQKLPKESIVTDMQDNHSVKQHFVDNLESAEHLSVVHSQNMEHSGDMNLIQHQSPDLVEQLSVSNSFSVPASLPAEETLPSAPESVEKSNEHSLHLPSIHASAPEPYSETVSEETAIKTPLFVDAISSSAPLVDVSLSTFVEAIDQKVTPADCTKLATPAGECSTHETRSIQAAEEARRPKLLYPELMEVGNRFRPLSVEELTHLYYNVELQNNPQFIESFIQVNYMLQF